LNSQTSASLFTLSDLPYLLYRIIPLPWLIRLARLQGRVVFLLRRRSARAVERNLGEVIALDGAHHDARSAALRFFEGQTIRSLLFHLTQRIDEERLGALLPMTGLHHLDTAVAEGRGTLLLASHLNSLGGLIAVIQLRRMGYDVRLATPENRDPWTPSWVRRAIYKLEGEQATSLLDSMAAFYCQFNIRPIVKALREGAIVVQTGDGWHSAGFVDVDFLGRRMPFSNGMMNIARSTGAMVVPMFVVGPPPDMNVVFEQPFEVRDHDHMAERIAYFASRVEAHVLANPELWQHFEVPSALSTMAGLREIPLEQRYQI
jgi:lauroyl/myristoyl acyltransferase